MKRLTSRAARFHRAEATVLMRGHSRRELSGLAVLLCLLSSIELLNAQTVAVWLSTDDRTILLQQQTPTAFSTNNAYNNPLVVDETQLYQQIEGFGASFTDTTGYILNEVATPAARTNAMNNLFTRAGGGIGLSFVRNPMGASD